MTADGASPAGGASVASALRVEVLTIFPELVSGYCAGSIFGRAIRAGTVEITVHDLRIGATGPHRSVDDAPFGGGAGMVLAPGPAFAAVEAIVPVRPLYLLSPAGRRLDQGLVEELQAKGAFSLLCGRYEGVDQRIADHLVDGEISLGDFVLAGGSSPRWRSSRPSRASCRAWSAMRNRPPRRASRRGCSSTRSTRVRRCSGAGRCPRSCAAATTPPSPPGVAPRRLPARSSAGRTSSRPAGASMRMRCDCSPSTTIL